jgi:ATP-binding cassette subfamily C protein
LYHFQSGAISIGAVLVIILLSAEFFIPLRLLGSFFHVAMNRVAASEKIFHLLDIEEKQEPSHTDGMSNNLQNPSTTLNNVTFSYDQGRNALENVSLSIEDKGFVALVGECGSGKSTIASLITKNYPVSSGG